jgi:hypothetical protein
MMYPCEGSYASAEELAAALYDNEQGALRQLLEDDPAALITAALSVIPNDELGEAIDKCLRKIAEDEALRLWDECPHAYCASGFELRERIES